MFEFVGALYRWILDTLIWSLFEHKIFFIRPYHLLREKFSIMTQKPLSCIYSSLMLFMGQNSGYMRFIGLPFQNLSQYMPHFAKRKVPFPCSFSDIRRRRSGFGSPTSPQGLNLNTLKGHISRNSSRILWVKPQSKRSLNITNRFQLCKFY